MYDQELPSLPVPGFTDQHTDLKAFVALILKDAKEGSYHFYDFDDDLIIDSNHITNTHDWEKLEALFSPYSQVPTPKPALFLNRTVCEFFELPSGWQEKSVSMISLRHTLPSMNLGCRRIIHIASTTKMMIKSSFRARSPHWQTVLQAAHCCTHSRY